MSDWQVGDLALCVVEMDDDYFRGSLDGRPIRGLTYTVSAVAPGVDIYGNPGTALKFQEIGRAAPRWRGYNSQAFRKVTPPAADEFDRETIELMNRAPAKEPAA